MKLLLISLLLVIGYLLFVYARFYYVIGMKDLKAPTQTQYTVAGSASSGLAKYVALGDSLTAGVGASSYQKTFVYLYANKLSSKSRSVQVVNMGVPGATTRDLITSQLPQVTREKPDHITLLIGINDLHNRVSVKEFAKNFEIILDSLVTSTDAQITVLNLPYLGSTQEVLPPFNKILNFQTKQFNDIISAQVLEHNLKLVDLYGLSYDQTFNNTEFYSEDLFHPGDGGYQLWSQILADAD